MNNVNYYKARSYAWKINHDDYMDVLHDAYLSWFNKTGDNLFDEPMPRVLKVVKLTYMARWKAISRHNTEFVGLGDLDTAGVDTPENILIAKETKQRYTNLATNEKSAEILELKSLGLRNVDIAEKWNVTKAVVTWYLRNIDQKSILN